MNQLERDSAGQGPTGEVQLDRDQLFARDRHSTDIAAALAQSDTLGFLIDIVLREEEELKDKALDVKVDNHYGESRFWGAQMAPAAQYQQDFCTQVSNGLREALPPAER
jgi:hypothetical protein